MKTTEYTKPLFDKSYRRGTELKALILKKLKFFKIAEKIEEAQNKKPETDGSTAGS
jgi:hypothetical protein